MMSRKSQNLSTDTIWFVTGCSSGLGAALSRQIVKTGHRLVATARKTSSLSFLEDNPRILKLGLDVTSTENITSALAAALEKFGRIDVVVNNAGYSLMGDTEGASDADARKQLETNFWGVVNVSKEALRIFRDVNPKGSGGTLVQVSSMGGFLAFPGAGFYHASKFAVEGFTETLSKEVHPDWNIRFLILEPGGVKTNYASSSLARIPPHPAYNDPSFPTRQLEAYMQHPGFEANCADADLVMQVAFNTIVNQGDRPLPLRLPLGADSWGTIKAKLVELDTTMDQWRGVSESTMTKEQKSGFDAFVNAGK